MPAIQPVRLKKQAADLADYYNQPAAFIRSLHALLDLYTDHTHRSGQAGEPAPLMGAYNTPPPVMRQVWFEVSQALKTHPEAIFPLCDALWAEQNHDLKLLATQLLGMCPFDTAEPMIERLQGWILPGLDQRLLDALLQQGLMKLLQKSPGLVMELLDSWLTSSEGTLQEAGMRALLYVIRSQGTPGVPGVFKLLTPYVRIAPPRLRSDILAVLTALARVSASETAYFLRQNLSAPENSDTAWMVRQVMAEFPEETRAGLRQAMKDSMR